MSTALSTFRRDSQAEERSNCEQSKYERGITLLRKNDKLHPSVAGPIFSGNIWGFGLS